MGPTVTPYAEPAWLTHVAISLPVTTSGLISRLGREAVPAVARSATRDCNWATLESMTPRRSSREGSVSLRPNTSAVALMDASGVRMS